VHHLKKRNIILNRLNKNGGTIFPKSTYCFGKNRTPFFNRFEKMMFQI